MENILHEVIEINPYIIARGSVANSTWPKFIYFSDYDNSDPLTVIDCGMDAVHETYGVRPNAIFIGRHAHNMLARHPDVQEIIVYAKQEERPLADYVLRNVVTAEDMALMATLLDIDNYYVSGNVYFLNNHYGYKLGIEHKNDKNMLLTYIPKNRKIIENGYIESRFSVFFESVVD